MREIKCVVIEASGKLYRLIPPGTPSYRKGGGIDGSPNWLVDWHDEHGKRRRFSTWTPEFELAEKFARDLGTGRSVRDARGRMKDTSLKLLKAAVPGLRFREAIIMDAIAGLAPDEALKLLQGVMESVAKRREQNGEGA